MRQSLKSLAAFLSVALLASAVRADEPKPAAPTQAPFKYIEATAYYIPPETTTEESGYFSLNDHPNGKVYVGTAAYGRNSYLVEFDPKTEKMTIVLDTHKTVGLPTAPTGYAAQSKLHTRNFVGPSGKIYVGSKQGYPSQAENEMIKRGEKIPVYKGGYVMTYDPKTGKAENLGMPMPLGDPRLPKDATEGEGVIDVTADESRGLIYVITCEGERWMMLDTKQPEKGYSELQPGLALKDQPNTLVDKRGRATAITTDLKIARYDPSTDKVTVDELMVGGKSLKDLVNEGIADPKSFRVHPDWRLAADGQTAYLQFLDDLRMFQVDLSGTAGSPVQAKSLGNRLEGKSPDSRSSISIAPDGRVYSILGVRNETGFGAGNLFHLVRYDPKTSKMEDLGVLKVKNPAFFDFKAPQIKNPDGSLRPIHGYHTLPDGALTPLHVVLAMVVTHNGDVYATTLYPFTLMKIDAADLK